MAVIYRTAFAEAYDERRFFIPFLSSFFMTRARDIVRAEKYKFDIRRGSRKVAPVISNITQRGSKIKKSVYTEKEFTPPIIALGSDFSGSDLAQKVFGMTAEDSALEEYMMQLMDLIGDDMVEIEKMILRNIELQASSIFQTGILNLYDELGNLAFTIDFKAKSTHFPTVGTSWTDPAADMDGDINSLIEVIQQDSDALVENLVFGSSALKNYLKGTNVQAKFDSRRIQSGEFRPNRINSDVRYLGDILIGSEYVACWKYLGRYEDPTNPTGSDVLKYVDDNNVIALPAADGINVDFRKVWCQVPRVTQNDPGYENILPASMELSNRQFTPRIWEDKNEDKLNIEIKARPMCLPASIDVFGCLDTIV